MTQAIFTTLKANALPGVPGGPYAANVPAFIPKLFILVANRFPDWRLIADRETLFILTADRNNRYPLEV